MPPCRHTSVAPRSHASIRAAHDFVECEVVRRAAQRLVRLALGEGAELAAIVADVGVVDVAVDDVTNHVAADRLAQFVGGGERRAGSRRRARANSRTISGSSRRPPPIALAMMASISGSTVRQQGAPASAKSRQARRPVVVARPAFGIDRAPHPRRDLRRRASSLGRAHRPDRPAAAAPGSCQLRRALRQRRDRRPRRLGVHVIGRHRRHAAPVVDAGADQLLIDARRQVGRRLDMHVRPAGSAAPRRCSTADRPDRVPARPPAWCSAWRGNSAR